MPTSPAPAPFRSTTSPEALDDLRRRLRATRWPDAPEDAGWSLGTDLSYLRELVAYWADGFDWPAQEEALNRLPRYTVDLGGLRTHVIHARAVAPSGPVLPLVLCHGWPDSCWRYLEVIDLLTDPGAYGADPADAFDVVVPGMPGFGWSERLSPALDPVAVAAVHRTKPRRGRAERVPGSAAGPPGGGAVRLLAVPGRHPAPAAGVARTDDQRRPDDRASARRPLRRVRAARAIRRSCVRSSVPTADPTTHQEHP